MNINTKPYAVKSSERIFNQDVVFDCGGASSYKFLT